MFWFTLGMTDINFRSPPNFSPKSRSPKLNSVNVTYSKAKKVTTTGVDSKYPKM